jgi:hypothetical protein
MTNIWQAILTCTFGIFIGSLTLPKCGWAMLSKQCESSEIGQTTQKLVLSLPSHQQFDQFSDLPKDLKCIIIDKYLDIETNIVSLPVNEKVVAIRNLVRPLLKTFNKDLCQVLKTTDWSKHSAFADTLIISLDHKQYEIPTFHYNPRWAQMLLLRSGNPHIRPKQYDSQVLVEAARYGQLDVCKNLLGRGLQADTQNSLALICASKAGHIAVCQLLLDQQEHPARANAMDSNALRLAACNGHANVCRLLLERGSEKTITTNGPLVLAASLGHAEVCRVLLEYGGNNSHVKFVVDLASRCSPDVRQILRRWVSKKSWFYSWLIF